MAETVYIMCAATSLCCALLLMRGHRRMRSRLLFWSCACFLCFSVTNILLFADLVLFPNVDLLLLRNSITLLGLLMLLYGMIWDTV